MWIDSDIFVQMNREVSEQLHEKGVTAYKEMFRSKMIVTDDLIKEYPESKDTFKDWTYRELDGALDALLLVGCFDKTHDYENFKRDLRNWYYE